MYMLMPNVTFPALGMNVTVVWNVTVVCNAAFLTTLLQRRETLVLSLAL